jgi:O-antigen ligase
MGRVRGGQAACAAGRLAASPPPLSAISCTERATAAARRGECENGFVAWAASRMRKLILPGGTALVAAAFGVLAGIEPLLAIGAALALAFVLLAVANLYLGLAVFTMLTFVIQIPGLAGSGVTFSKAAGLILAISWLAVFMLRPDARADLFSTHPVAGYVLVLFLGWIGVSQLWAEEPAAALDSLFRLALNAVLFLIIFTAVRERHQAVVVIAAFVGGATFAALYGLLFVTPEAGEGARLSGGLDNPNELATILVAAMSLALGLAAAMRGSPVLRMTALVAATLCLAGVFFTGSRGGLVALGVALIAFLVTGSRFRGRLLLVAAVTVAAGIGYYNFIASEHARERISDLEEGGGRTDVWEIGWRMVEAEPVHGVGAGNFPTSSAEFLLTQPGSIERADFIIDTPKVTHNTYLEVWAELGTVGLLMFLFILGFGLYAAAKAAVSFGRQGDARMEVLARSLLVALAAVIAADFFGSRQYNKELWILLGLAPALWSIARRSEESRT